MRKLLLRFRDDVSGFTLIESTFFILILLFLMVTGIEWLRYNRLELHVKLGAEGFADLLGQRQNPLRDLNWSEDASALAWLMPEVPAEAGQDWREKLGVQASYARFVQDDPNCQTDCVSTSARMVWTWDGGTSGSRALLADAAFLRECDTRLVPGNGTSGTTLPGGFFKGKDVLIVTLVAYFRPRILGSLIKQKLLVMQTYVPTPTDRLQIDPFGLANEVVACP